MSLKKFAAVAAGVIGFAGAAAAQETPAPTPATAPASAEQALPLWEFRVGASALYAPDYPGSDENQWRGIAAPLFVYRGERIRIGGDEPNSAARAIAVESRTFEVSLSVDGAYGADSNDNDARRGMPDLDPQLEIGPQLTVNLFDSDWTPEGRRRLRLFLPVRLVGATDFSDFEELGYTFAPTLSYRRQWPGDRRMSFSTSVSAVWATEGVQDYFYDVAPIYATANRPAYDADGGYMGAHLHISARREVRPGLQLFATYRLRSLEGAANQDSPLHREDLTHSFSISAVWTAFKSDRPAHMRD